MTVSIVLAMASQARAQDLFEVGSDDTEINGADQAYKLNLYDVSADVQLLRFANELAGEQDPYEIRYVVYRDAGPNTWELLWQSDLESIGVAMDFYESPEIGLLLEGGRSYLLGFYMTNNDISYTYGESGGDLGWADQTGVVYLDNNLLPGDEAIPFDPLVDGFTEGLAYHQQVAIESGEDADGDGFGSFEDCDDQNPEVFPGHDEWCDEVDNDCDGEVDEEVISETWLPDDDGDGFGDASAPFEVCDGTTPANGTKTGRDCDDGDAAIHPDASEECDGVDNNCNDQVDEGLDALTYWPDADGDGFGNPDQPAVTGCGTVTGLVRNDDDCDDLHAGVFPGAPEACDGLDNDCDGAAGPDEIDGDVDGDLACDECDDADPTVYIGAPEPCDGVDHDCDGVIPDPADCPSPAFDGEDIVLGACEGCASGGGPGAAAPWMLAAILLRRRR